MGQKVNPKGFRLAVRRDWDSRWYANKGDYAKFLAEDYKIREFLREYPELKSASVARVFIERAGARVRVKIFTARPGVVIGQKGASLDQLKAKLSKFLGKDIMLDIQEIKKQDLVAFLVAESIALQLERRVSFRRAIKKAIQTSLAMGAEGIKVQLSGRLGGAEIARTEWQRKGKIPLQTLRENIDYGFTEAHTLYGKIGVKVWLCLKSEDVL
ncbi:MAG: 30S ribosomal protein S3 [Opitutales bacterium]|nr:30S ribosomal protein S3 [Opitutales bacterium]